jgi:enoyl-[acyl-carrier-protein] reductase (NADH)
MLVKAAAEELGSAQIRVNAVQPGMIRTAVTADMFTNKPMIDAFLEQIPLGRTGEPDDIGRAVRFLAGPESVWITGQTIAADGGQILRRTPDFTPFLDQMFGRDIMDQVRAGKSPQVASGPSMALGPGE